MVTFPNSNDLDKTLHNAAFHQSLQYLLGQNQLSAKGIQFLIEN